MIMSWGNEADQLCQKESIEIAEPTQKLTVELPALSVCTYIFTIQNDETAIKVLAEPDDSGSKTYYDLLGRRLNNPQGLCIERWADGTSRKLFMK